MQNKTIIQKAEDALNSLTVGRLDASQNQRFIRGIIASPTLLKDARVVEMPSGQHKINRLGFGHRILRAAPVEGLRLRVSQRARPTAGQIKLNAEEVIAEVRLPYSVIESNLEGGNITVDAGQSAGGIMDTLIDLIADRAALDLEELGLRGDVTSYDPYLALMDGWLKQASGNVVVSNSAELTNKHFGQMVKAIPSELMRNPADYRYYANNSIAIDAKELQAARPTTLGDQQTQNALQTQFNGITVAPAAMMPDGAIFLTPPKNLILGMTRDITIEYDKDITTREFIIVLTARVALGIESPEATSVLVGIGGETKDGIGVPAYANQLGVTQ